MDWDAFWKAFDEAIRDYDERTFADSIDGGYDLNVTDDEDVWDDA